MDETKEERARRLAAKRQAKRKARKLAAGRVQWKCWVHPDDVPELVALAKKLSQEREQKPTQTYPPVTGC